MFMFKNTINIFIILLLFYSISLASDIKYDIRKVKWGMSPFEVMDSEEPRTPNNSVRDILSYTDEIDGKDALVAYLFNDNKLNEVIIYFKLKNNYESEMFVDKIKQILSKKYKSENKEPLYNFEKTLRRMVLEFSNENTYVILINTIKRDGLVAISYKDKEYYKLNKEKEIEKILKESKEREENLENAF